MLYLLAQWINDTFNPPGFDLFRFITFRSAAAAITAMVVSFFVGPKIIALLKRLQMKEQDKTELQQHGLHMSKAGTPTMGGFIVLAAILLPAILWADLSNVYILLILFVTIALGAVGFLDDYLKVIKKKKGGLPGKFKLIGQVITGGILASVIILFPESLGESFAEYSTATTIPFMKDYNLEFGRILYPIFIIIVLTATSNAVNLTDGLDGLAIGTVSIAALALAALAYVTGNINFADYLNIIYLEGSGELTVYTAALVGAGLGFLWYNSHPAQVFMGDTGSLALGGAIGALAILLKKEMLIPILGGVFFAESLSVILQVSYFKYTKKKYGEGKRLFRIAPLHHHFEKTGIHETKIVTRFYIVAIILAILMLTTFKVR
ncbi:MAG: phospho-N-acetylmuramoyl-pentapeptide-transferase [Candidatus Kapaibacteriales bacterium]